MRILVADKLPAEVLEAMTRLGFEVDSQPELSADDIAGQVPGACALVVRSTRVNADVLDAGNHLQLVIRAGAGTNTIDCKGAAERGVFVANCPGKNAIAVAELTMGLILALDRRIPDNVNDLRRRQWKKALYGKGQGLYGRTLGIIGMGRIGQEVASRAQAFGMRIIAWSRSLTDDLASEFDVQRCESVLDVCSQADAISVHVALSPETRHLIGATEINAMKDGALLINMARGGVVDDTAMLEAIDTGRIRAAGDVFEQEPKGGEAAFESPLGNAQGFYGTHHIGAATQQAQLAVASEVIRILDNWKATGVVFNCVNGATEMQADGQILVRHLDRVGVLAAVLDVLKRAHINVKEMQNTLFQGAVAASANITVEQAPPADVITQLQNCSQHVLSVVWMPQDPAAPRS